MRLRSSRRMSLLRSIPMSTTATLGSAECGTCPGGPIVNLTDAFESAGGVVIFRDFGTQKFDGMSCWPKHGPPLFFINSAIPVDRARLTLAHELGHLIMHATAPARDPQLEANAFASELLVPRAEVISDLRRLRFGLLPELEAYWRVSMGALVMAAREAAAIPDSKVRSLMVQLSRRGYRTAEPYPLSPEEPRIVREAIRVHLQQHGYAVDELAGLAGRLPDEFRILYWPGEVSPQLRVVR